MFLVVVFLVGSGTLTPLETHKVFSQQECQQLAAIANHFYGGGRLALCVNPNQGI